MRIGFIGAGNVASHLAKALYSTGHEIVIICSRNIKSANELAGVVNSVAVNLISEIPDYLDIIIIATNDSSIEDVSNQLRITDTIIAHTSGSVPLDSLSKRHLNSAVIYPLQTFSKGSELKISDIPFFLEASNEHSLHIIETLIQSISHNIFPADSNIRAKLHVAGVLSSNFPIFLIELSRRILNECGLPLSILRPLVKVSVDKAFDMEPLNALTGPAKRGDIQTIKKHSESFSSDSEREIYDNLSDVILNEFNHKH